MAILIDENTRFLIQGITGKQGQLACKEMIKAGSQVVCGVTPGKGGENVENLPVYNSIEEAKQHHQIDASVVIVPAKFAKAAILESIDQNIKLINIITENIPVHDTAYCLAKADKKEITIIGATSAGIYSVGKSKSGLMGSGKSNIAFSPGKIGVISRSGGMSSETSLVLTQNRLGQSTVVSIGSDLLMGTTYTKLIKLFEEDKETKGIVIFGEIGGTAEEELADYLEKRKETNPFKKPIVAFISGKNAGILPKVSLGHAGAIINGDKGTRKNKVKVLKEAGVIILDKHHEIAEIMKEHLEHGI